MSLLAPLYFLGALAVGLPVLFHLIRRRPRGEMSFSSLMFLRPSPPRLTKRSRLDNWPLLLIRALALILLAAAFARPFVRSSSQLDAELGGRRLVWLIDTSASMRRGDLWQQATEQADAMLDQLQRGDALAVVAYDDSPRTLVSFAQAGRVDREQLGQIVRRALAETTPSWRATDLGGAITFAADMAAGYEPDADPLAADDAAAASGHEEASASGPAQLVLISDLQSGSDLEMLQGYPWPDHLQLQLHRVSPARPTNAWVELLGGSDTGGPDTGDPDSGGPEADETADDAPRQRTGGVRVRVTTSSDADRSQFRVGWADRQGRVEEASLLPASVPPGQSRVIRLESPKPEHTALVVREDDASFDNARYLVSPQPREVSVLYVGPEAGEPRDSLLYYLQRVPLSDERLEVGIETAPADQLAARLDPEAVPLVVLAENVSPDAAEQLREYVERGGHVLSVLASPDDPDETERVVRRLSGDDALNVGEGNVDDYAMFERIDFQHPLFAAMSEPQFNDFTKIRFWSHRRVDNLDDAWSPAATFDDGGPALLERPIGEGTLWVLAAGWQPAQSQLALSSKFPPLVLGFLALAAGSEQLGGQSTVGQPIAIEPSPGATITRFGGEPFPYESPEDAERLDRPGVYEWTDGEQTRFFAVNLARSESRTEPLPADRLESHGAVLGRARSQAERRAEQRQARDLELESRQKLWQWLLVLALALVALETWLGGWLSRRRSAASPSSATA